jgi:hypothetical protein
MFGCRPYYCPKFCSQSTRCGLTVTPTVGFARTTCQQPANSPTSFYRLVQCKCTTFLDTLWITLMMFWVFATLTYAVTSVLRYIWDTVSGLMHLVIWDTVTTNSSRPYYQDTISTYCSFHFVILYISTHASGHSTCSLLYSP